MVTLTASANCFLDLLLESGALKFGSFKTKSGRMSPYFFNTGAFDHGRFLNEVASCYADLILDHLPAEKLHLYGPAYKGIPLATSIAQEISRRTKVDVPFTFNRKEAKTHGEGGSFIGRALTSETKLIVVEDVMTGGTSIRETLEYIKPSGAQIAAVFIGVDREERGAGPLKAAQELTAAHGIKIHSLLNLSQIIEALFNRSRHGKIWITDDIKKAADEYRRFYG